MPLHKMAAQRFPAAVERSDMSYILDALKKSERERKQGAVPDVLTVQEDVQKARGKRPLWPIIVAMALLLNLVLFGWLFAPWKIGSGRNAPAVLPADPEQQGGILPETVCVQAVGAPSWGDCVPFV